MFQNLFILAVPFLVAATALGTSAAIPLPFIDLRTAFDVPENRCVPALLDSRKSEKTVGSDRPAIKLATELMYDLGTFTGDRARRLIHRLAQRGHVLPKMRRFYSKSTIRETRRLAHRTYSYARLVMLLDRGEDRPAPFRVNDLPGQDCLVGVDAIDKYFLSIALRLIPWRMPEELVKLREDVDAFPTWEQGTYTHVALAEASGGLDLILYKNSVRQNPRLCILSSNFRTRQDLLVPEP